jgi:hypothetical protein
MPRLKDRVWVLGMLIICGGFGGIAIVGYLTPVVELSQLDGRCRIGLPPKVSFPLLCFDVVINFLLTGVFFWLLRPVLSFHGLTKSSTWFGNKFASKFRRSVKSEVEMGSAMEGASLKSAMNKNIKTLLMKCLIGSSLVMLPTVANMAQFYIMNSRELGWVCLTICTLDSMSTSYSNTILSLINANEHSLLGRHDSQLADHRFRRSRKQSHNPYVPTHRQQQLEQNQSL